VRLLETAARSVQEIPSFRVDPLTPKCDTWCEFPVADRPNAVRQFLDAAAKDPSLIQAPWVLMIETDYVWMNPLQGVPLAESSLPGWGFPYGYIVPTYPGALRL
jgi:hydroxyproline O-arabinosyltransferase